MKEYCWSLTSSLCRIIGFTTKEFRISRDVENDDLDDGDDDGQQRDEYNDDADAKVVFGTLAQYLRLLLRRWL